METLAQTLIFRKALGGMRKERRATQNEACGLFKATRTMFLERRVAPEFFKWIFFQSFEQQNFTVSSIVWS